MIFWVCDVKKKRCVYVCVCVLSDYDYGLICVEGWSGWVEGNRVDGCIVVMGVGKRGYSFCVSVLMFIFFSFIFCIDFLMFFFMFFSCFFSSG